MEENTSEAPSELNKLIEKFKQNLEELRELIKLPQAYEKQAACAKKKLDEVFLPIIIQKLNKELSKATKKSEKDKLKALLENVVQEYKKIAPQNVNANDTLKIKVDEDYYKGLNASSLDKQRDKLYLSNSHKIHIEKAVLFNLVAYLELSFSELAQIILTKHPEILALNERKISIEELDKFANINDVKEFLISSEIEKLLFKPLTDFLDFFEKKVFKVNFPSLEGFRYEIIEIKERRNLLIHNGGIVNSRYMNNVDESIIKGLKLKKGDQIQLEKTYLENSVDKFELVGLEILALAALKFQDAPAKAEAADFINNIIYNTFAEKKKNYFLGENLARFMLSPCCAKYLNQMTKDYIQLNLWYLLKKQGKIEEFESESKDFDTSSKNDLIQLGYYSLIEKYDRAHRHLRASLKSESLTMRAYKKFPILEGLRKQKKSTQIVKEFQKETKKN